MKKRILLFGIICGLIISMMPLEVQAQHEILSYIYHKHQGTGESQGGCYGQPIYHAHKGNGLSGGQCYEQVIYHRHTGGEQEGGGCYTNPIYHAHAGNAEAKGGCYVEKFHKHESGCYTTAICTIKTDSYSYCFRTWYEYCFHHGETVHGEWYAVKSHSSCGQGKFDSTVKMCNSCKYIGVSEHNYEKQNCSRENELVGYGLGCGMSETTVVSYGTGCNKAEGKDIEGYALSCKKTGESIDGYGLVCGKETTVPVGFVKITNLSAGQADEVTLEASYWDRTASEGKGGELKVSSNPFIWGNASSGQKIGEGSRITVKQNGSYTVTLQAENQDIKREGLSVTIRVTNVKEYSGGGGESGSSHADNTGGNSHADNTGIPDTEKIENNNDNDVTVKTPNPKDDKTAPLDTSKKSIRPTKKQESEAAPTKSPVIIKPAVKIENKEVKVQELDGEAAEIEVKEVMAKPAFWSTPVARAFVITLSGVITILGLFGLWILLFRYVGIYGDDGEGSDCFLGFGFIRKEETFLLVISEHVMDRACTSRYCLRPAILFYRMHEQSELLVEVKGKKISLVIEREMTFKY